MFEASRSVIVKQWQSRSLQTNRSGVRLLNGGIVLFTFLLLISYSILDWVLLGWEWTVSNIYGPSTQSCRSFWPKQCLAKPQTVLIDQTTQLRLILFLSVLTRHNFWSPVSELFAYFYKPEERKSWAWIQVLLLFMQQLSPLDHGSSSSII